MALAGLRYPFVRTCHMGRFLQGRAFQKSHGHLLKR